MTPKGRGGRRAARLTVDALLTHATHTTVVAALVLVAGLLPAAAHIRSTAKEETGPAATREVTELHSRIRLGADGTVRVTERLTYDFADDGAPAVRRLPHTGTVADSPVRDLGLEDVRVTDDGDAGPVEVARDGAWTEVTIGDPDHPLGGTRTFEIEYAYRNLVVPGDQGDPRLFFNVVGTEWTVPVRDVTARAELPGEPRAASCHAGPEGSRDACTSTGEVGDTMEFTQDLVEPGQAMSIDLTLSPQDVALPEPEPEPEREGAGPPAGVWFTLGILAVLGFLVLRPGRSSRGGAGGGHYYGGGGYAGGGSSGGAGDGGGGGGGD
ncbi:hypothetical protein SUDANB121_00476 [Nocardiopsis dassonvillei]|uniref:DUF2207 domain-containing protein n=1 Tax=Nocardiopsis dassonvillei TaxID=2014 RepID=UPI003F5581D9